MKRYLAAFCALTWLCIVGHCFAECLYAQAKPHQHDSLPYHHHHHDEDREQDSQENHDSNSQDKGEVCEIVVVQPSGTSLELKNIHSSNEVFSSGLQVLNLFVLSVVDAKLIENPPAKHLYPSFRQTNKEYSFLCSSPNAPPSLI